MKGKIKNLLWLSWIAVMVAATLPVVSAQGTEAVVYVDPSMVETLDTRFHYPVVGEAVGVEMWTTVVGEAVGVEMWTTVVNETLGVGDGDTTVFYLANTPVGESTETVYIAGHVAHAGKYTIDYWNGTITFDNAPRKDAVITADYKYGNLEFSLAETPVIPESETIYVDGVPQTRDTDYAIDFWTGEITFLYLPADTATVTADYTSYIAEFSLSSPPLDYESETIYVDGVPQTRYVDYTIVDKTGVVTFLYVPSDSAEITADYSYWSDEFYVDINVANATDLWTVGFKVDYAPFAKTIIAAEIIKGDFLDQDGYNTHFVKTIDVLTGTVNIGYTRLPTFLKPNVGANGNGTLATIKFKIVSAGNSPINLVDVDLLDSNGAALLHQTADSAYYGPTAELIMGSTGKRAKTVGDIQYFGTKIKNLASVPLEVRTHWDMYRVEDGQRLQIYSGQIYSGFGPIDFEYLYVNEYDPWLEWDWINPGTSLFGPPDGNYAESSIDGAMTSVYGFEDLVLGDRLIGNVILEGYTQYPNGADEGMDIDVYSIDPAMFVWLGSLYGTETWDWGSVRWLDETVSERIPATLTEEGLNSLSVLIYNYDPGLTGGPMRVDSLRVKVEFSKFNPVFPESFVIQPEENLELPVAYWTLKSYDTGKWITTLTGEYRYTWTDEDGYHTTPWIQAEKVRTYTWWVTGS